MVVVYAGGDDVFVVGAWDEILKFAKELKENFTAYTCNRLTFSCGIAFFGEHFPIYSMAKATQELEDMAKKNQEDALNGSKERKKDSIALFGKDKAIDEKGNVAEIRHVHFWDEFLNDVEDKRKFLELAFCFDKELAKRKVNPNQIEAGMSFLYRLKILLQNIFSDDGKKGGKIDLARLAYTLARIEPATKEEDAKKFTKMVREKIYTWVSNTEKGKKNQKQLLTAIDLIIYENRKGD